MPLVPVDVPLAPESIEPVPDPTDLEGLGVGFELDAGFPPWGAVSAAKAGAATNCAATAAALRSFSLENVSFLFSFDERTTADAGSSSHGTI